MAEAMSAEPASPPQAKKRGAPEEEKLSLEAIREVVRSEVGGSTAALRAEISQRMDRVETGVTAQLEKTLERLAAINSQQQEQQRTVEAMQGEQYSMNARLQALESTCCRPPERQARRTPTLGGESLPSSWGGGATTRRRRRRSTTSSKW